MIRNTLLGVLGLIATSVTCVLAQPSGTSPLSPPPNGPRRADPTWVAIRNCTVHPRPGESIEHATVVFRDGVIQAVMPGEGSPIPLGPRVIAGDGLHVYPAFIDAYVEVDAPAPAAGAPGVHWNTNVTPQRRALDGAGIDAATAESLRKLGFGAAAISPRAGIFRGTASVVSLAKPSDDASIARPPVYREDVYQAAGLDTARGGYPGSLMGSIALIRQTLSDADWERESASEPTSLRWLDKASMPVLLCDTSDELDALRWAKILREFDRKGVILGSGTEFRRLESIAKDRLELVLPLAFPRTPDVSSVGKVEQAELRELMTWEQAPTNPRRLAKAGVTFSLTTAKLRDRAQFMENIRRAITCGLTDAQALAALTTTPAAMLGVADQVGTIDTGKRANLILADGPIFAPKTRVRSVWIDGKPHEFYAPPERLDGEWTVEIPGAAKAERSLLIEKGNDITVRRDGKSVKATRVTVDGQRISYTMDHEPLDGNPGVYAMTGAIERDGSGRAVRLVGQGVRANGDTFTWSANRRPPSLEGLWTVFSATPHMAPTPLAMLVISKDGTITRVTTSGEEVRVPSEWDGATLTLDSRRVTVDFDQDPPVMTSESGDPSAGNQPWIARRTGVQGAWKVTEYDGAPRAEDDALALDIGKDAVTLSFSRARAAQRDNAGDAGEPNEKAPEQADSGDSTERGAPREGRGQRGGARGERAGRGPRSTVIKGEEVKIDGRTVTFTHDLAALGAEGKSSNTLRVFADTLTGESVLADGTRHTFKATRQVDPKKDEEDTSWAKDIPESLPTPFGPYGFETLPPQGTYILTNATVWTNTTDGVIKGATVVVSAGKITGVFPNGNTGVVPTGADAITIDCQGKHLTPGIIDAHSHTGISRGVNEGGQAITSEVRIQDVTNPDTTNWYWQLAGGVTTVLNLHGSANAIGGQSQTNKVRWGAAHPDDMHFEGAIPGIKFALGENPRGANSGGAPRDLGGPGAGQGARYPQSRMGVEMLIRDRFTAAREYQRERDTQASANTPKEVPGGALAPSDAPRRLTPAPGRRDLELEALSEILQGKRLVHCHSYRQDEILMLCLVAKDFGFKIGTFQHILEGYKVADYVRDYSGGGSGFSDWWAYKVEVQDAIPQGLPLMSMVGATMSFNSDSDELARRLNVEAAKAVKYANLSETDALKFVTLNPAKQLRIDSRVGTIEVGKDADIALWSGHPLSAMSKCERTFVDGRQLFSLEDDAAHRQRIQKERSRLIQKILADKRRPESPGTGGPGGGEGGRRRGPGGAGAPGGPRPTEDWSEQEAAAIRQYYLDLYNRGKTPNEPGVCGCGLLHW